MIKYTLIQQQCIEELKRSISNAKKRSKHNTHGWSSEMNKRNRKQAKQRYKAWLKLYYQLTSKKLTIKQMIELDKETIVLPYALYRKGWC